MTAGRYDVPLHALDSCFEGGVPATLCTCDRAGTPNVSFLSVVHRVDEDHVALSFQFFRKTKANLEENPQARLLVVDPTTAIEFRLSLSFVRTETEGPMFDRLATSVAAIASQTGMEGAFALRGADVYRVLSCERFDNGVEGALPVRTLDCLAQLSRCTIALAACSDLDELLSRALSLLDEHLGYPHSFLLAVDEGAQTLFSVASHGYSPSGVGAEVPIGAGLIGMAAKRRSSIRVANLSRERTFAEAVHSTLADSRDPRPTIALPGLAQAQSQLVVPVLSQQQLLGVLCVQSETPAAFLRVDEQVVRVVADQLASCMARIGGMPNAQEVTPPRPRKEPAPDAQPARIRYYADDDSIFVDNKYLIRGVAGRVLWLLLEAYEAHGRHEFTNRELRLDARLGLPAIKDNLETRLIMLRKRLEEKCPFVRIRRTGRGRFELELARAVRLEQA